MKTILKAAILLALLTGVAMSADTNPPLLSSMPCPTPTPAPEESPACPPAPPMCPPAPTACPPAPPVCATPDPAPAPVSACAAPAPMLCETPGMMSDQGASAVAEYKLVTQKKKVWHDEAYLVNEKRVQLDKETRHKIKETKGVRLARVPQKDSDNDVKLIAYKAPLRSVSYDVTIRTEYEVSVLKNRKVATEVEEFKLVPVKRWARR